VNPQKAYPQMTQMYTDKTVFICETSASSADKPYSIRLANCTLGSCVVLSVVEP